MTRVADTAPHATPDPTLKHDANAPPLAPPLTEICTRVSVLELKPGGRGRGGGINFKS